jgi:hypothetical protein
MHDVGSGAGRVWLVLMSGRSIRSLSATLWEACGMGAVFSPGIARTAKIQTVLWERLRDMLCYAA